ncbi:MAG: endonuclease domain-containing protein, partial [bacterium]
MTQAERKLWHELLRGHALRFIRQHPIDNYIVDFYCPTLKLVLEVDGDTHYTEEGKTYDAERTYILEQYGLRIIRYTNTEILQSFPAVCEDLKRKINDIKTFQPSATSLEEETLRPSATSGTGPSGLPKGGTDSPPLT